MQTSSPPNSYKVGLLILWVLLTSSALTASSWILVSSFGKTSEKAVLGLYNARTPENTQTSFEAESTDSRALRIERVYEKFNCPLATTAEFTVQAADEYGIPYWLVSAVSFQESLCGRRSPKLNSGADSYNAWGYGIWGKNIKRFDSWESGITAVSKYFGVNFYSKGVDDPCEIMKTYTPFSDGTWCEGVKYFGELIENFSSE